MLVFTEPTAQRPVGGAAGAEHAPQRRASIGSPSGVPVPCASTYCDLRRRDPGVGVGRAQHLLLGRGVGRGQPLPRAVVVDRAAADHRSRPGRRRPARPRQALEHDHAAALAADVAIGARRRTVAAAVGGQRAEPAERDRGLGPTVEVDAAGERQSRLAGRRLSHARWTATSDGRQPCRRSGSGRAARGSRRPGWRRC